MKYDLETVKLRLGIHYWETISVNDFICLKPVALKNLDRCHRYMLGHDSIQACTPSHSNFPPHF